MSYEIYYDRAFIRVNDKFIPVVNSGSNNCWEISWNGREIPEKGWSVLNWRNRAKVLYTADEIREIAKDYENLSQDSGMSYKSRHVTFSDGEFERWILNGMKNAYTVEEYVAFGNQIYILDYSANNLDDWKEYPFSTTEELLTLLEKLKESKELCVKFANSRSVLRPTTQRKKACSPKNNEKYYVLQGDFSRGVGYFCSIGRKNIRYSYEPIERAVRGFTTEKQATAYAEKYKDRMGKYNLRPFLVDTAVAAQA